ncbi:MAG: phage head-tail connector protein [Bacillaceae bacterium]
MDYTEVKAILGYKTNKHDSYIDTVIPMFIEWMEDDCNYCFRDESGNYNLRGGAKIALAKMIEHNINQAGLSSKTMGEVQYTYDTNFPVSILNMLAPYRRIRV